MSLLPTLCVASSAIVPRPAERVRGVGNAGPSNTFDGECAGESSDRRSAPDDRRGAALSRIGTGAGAPYWNGPRLKPAFVAQVLGQVMMDGRERALSLAPAAYRSQSAQIPNGSLFNADI